MPSDCTWSLLWLLQCTPFACAKLAVTQARSQATVDRPSGAMLVLARESQDLQDLLPTLANLRRSSQTSRYPYVFLTDTQPFSASFRHAIEGAVGGHVAFGVVPTVHWQVRRTFKPSDQL